MLEKVIAINNVGVIKAGVPKALDLDKVTLIYADNARGKSTFSAMLQACAEADSEAILVRKTVGSEQAPKVLLRFKAKSGDFTAQFHQKAWGGGQPHLYVFNQEFVERNVYASTGVTPDQRASLLDLALGDAAVAQQQQFNKQSDLQRTKAGEVRTAELALTGFRGQLTVDQFIALALPKDADAKLAELEKQIADAKAVAQVLARPAFKKVTVPLINLDGFKRIAAQTFEKVQDGAEELVKKHLNSHNGASTERWIAEGLNHLPEPECPFCGQETNGLALLEAYKSYFNQKYKDHLDEVAAMKAMATDAIPRTLLQSWGATTAFNEGAAGQWRDAFEFKLPSIDVAGAQAVLDAVTSGLTELANVKGASPLDALDPSRVAELEQQLQMVTGMADAFNAEVDELNTKIELHRKSLQAVDLGQLNGQQNLLKMQISRHDAKTIPLIEAVTTARSEHKAAEAAKNQAKEKLDELMAALLAKFEAAINDWLVRFGAPFTLEKMTTSFAGGAPRSQYVINVRGAKVIVGPGGPGELPFHAALSEGDKRTLAFAFFLAKLFAEPNRAGAVVVLDDVFTSLDAHRRHNTGEAIIKMAQECSQVIALGHDAHFLRDIRKRLTRKGISNSLELCFQRDEGNYSVLSPFDLDEFCASDYYKNYVLVEKFIEGQVPPEKMLDVAKALRPLVEGHLHRCFPKRFKDGQTVGEMLGHVKSAPKGNPLEVLQPLLPDLVSFNDFAAAYHHDTSGGHPRTDITDAELKKFGQAALNFIQQRKLW